MTRRRLLPLGVFGWRKRAPIIVVSGLPRSGTSLMMQMLQAAGIPLLTDGERPADASNPRGYYEYAPVKRLAAAPPDWLPAARGHAVKVVSPLLHHLPAGEQYRVIFMERDLGEIYRSQRRMMAREADLTTDDFARWQADNSRHLLTVHAWLRDQAHIATLTVTHQDSIHRPLATARRVCDFLGGSLDPARMAAAVDPTLYRERRDPAP